MSTLAAPAAIIPRTEHPDYVAAKAVRDAAREAFDALDRERDIDAQVLARTHARDVVAGHSVIAPGPDEVASAEAYLALDSRVDEARQAWYDAGTAFNAVRVRLGLARA